VLIVLVARAFDMKENGEVTYTLREGALDDDSLHSLYVNKFGFAESGQTTEENHPILYRESPNYIRNPHPPTNQTHTEIKQGSGGGDIHGDTATSHDIATPLPAYRQVQSESSHLALNW
jgi:hypothetical protein